MARPLGKISVLTARQARAATMLGSGDSVGDVCKTLGISRATLNKWEQREDFNKIRQECYDRVLSGVVPQAVKVLVDQLRSKNDWVAQNAASRLLSVAQSAQGKAEAGITVEFNAILGGGEVDSGG